MRIFPLGDNAVTAEFGTEISTELNCKALSVAAYFENSPFPGFIEAVPAYASTTIFYDPPKVRTAYPEFAAAFDAVRSRVKEAETENISRSDADSQVVEIPVIVDAGSSLDIDVISDLSGLSSDNVLDIFFERTYTVFMLGFLPGFAYMGEVDERIAVPRKQSPRSRVSKGSVGIAGKQTGVYPFESPGGWQIIGRTEMPMFDPASEPPVLLKPGDAIKFIRI